MLVSSAATVDYSQGCWQRGHTGTAVLRPWVKGLGLWWALQPWNSLPEEEIQTHFYKTFKYYFWVPWKNFIFVVLIFSWHRIKTIVVSLAIIIIIKKMVWSNTPLCVLLFLFPVSACDCSWWWADSKLQSHCVPGQIKQFRDALHRMAAAKTGLSADHKWLCNKESWTQSHTHNLYLYSRDNKKFLHPSIHPLHVLTASSEITVGKTYNNTVKGQQKFIDNHGISAFYPQWCWAL